LDVTKNNKIHLHNFVVLGKHRKLARYVKNWTHLMIRKKMKRVQNGSNWHKRKDWIVYQRKENFLSTHHFLKTWNSDFKNWFKAKHYKRMWNPHTKGHTFWHIVRSTLWFHLLQWTICDVYCDTYYTITLIFKVMATNWYL